MALVIKYYISNDTYTCFFQVCILPYSTREIAAEKIKYAIHSIDMSMR